MRLGKSSHKLSLALVSLCFLKVFESVNNDTDADLPNPDDAEEVATAIFRIQDTYQFSPADIIAKDISDFNHPKRNITARDCFDIGMVAYNKSDHYHALMWLQEADDRLKLEEVPTIEKLEIWRPLAVALHAQGNHAHAFRLITQLRALLKEMKESERTKALENFQNLMNLMDTTYNAEYAPDCTTPAVNKRTDNQSSIFEEMCRAPEHYMELICYYRDETPFLRLAPAKVEVLHVDPLILRYREILSENETQIIQSLVKDDLQRGKVIIGHERKLSDRRTSTTAWVGRKDHPVIATVHKRIADFTGMDMERDEPLQVARYGFGGHYYFHYDHMTAPEREKYGFHGSFNHDAGDRTATLMFYLAEPEGGGATVFPYLDITVYPSKNDAVFWYNLRKDGEGIDDALHGGCPVISGTKWVANQWIRERGQEFARPCGLYEDEIDLV